MRRVLLTALFALAATLCASYVVALLARSSAERTAIARLHEAGANLEMEYDELPRWLAWLMRDPDRQRVVEIDLRRARVDDALLKHCSACPINELDISFFPDVTDTGLAYLARTRTLKFVNVSGTGVTDAGVKAFRRKRPDCRIWRGSLPNAGLVIEPAELDFGSVPEIDDYYFFKVTVILANPGPQPVSIESFTYS